MKRKLVGSNQALPLFVSATPLPAPKSGPSPAGPPVKLSRPVAPPVKR